jgi:putative ABC transport system substrate-binding protein
LENAGFVEGRNVAIEYRWGNDRNERLPGMAAELVNRKVDVIVAAQNVAAQAAQKATTSIPVVFAVGFDPVKFGLVDSLNRPGGNLTGGITLNVDLGPKRLELLHELVPNAAGLAYLLNPANPNFAGLLRAVQDAAQARAVRLHVLRASSEKEIDAAFEKLAVLRPGGLAIGADGFFNRRMEQFAALTLRHKIPTVYQFEFASLGGLASYSGDVADLYRQVGAYTARILKGEKPADLPVQLATRVELVINLRTATALGVAVPLSLLGRADKVIE